MSTPHITPYFNDASFPPAPEVARNAAGRQAPGPATLSETARLQRLVEILEKDNRKLRHTMRRAASFAKDVADNPRYTAPVLRRKLNNLSTFIREAAKEA